jgi:alpha/beta superfamily hydrolase
VFVPFEGHHLGAVLTVPDDRPQGLVLLVTGTGAPRSHRFQLWTRAARALAENGVACVRMDYLGIGDSTGRLVESPLGDVPRDQALTVLRFAMNATGVTRAAVAGNCSGSLVALSVAAEAPECIGAVCILPRILEPSTVNRVVIRARRSRVASLARTGRLLRPLVSRLRGRKGRPTSVLRGNFARALTHARLLFVYSPQDTDSYNEKSRVVLERMVSGLPPSKQERFELRILPEGPLSGFESLGIQRTVIGLVVGWLVEAFDLRPAETERPRTRASIALDR